MSQQTKPKFVVVIPTIRKQEFLGSRLTSFYSNLDYPTDVLILEGSAGKSTTLNRILNQYNDATATYWVTLDDDVQLPATWQIAIHRAFTHAPEYGALGVHFTDTPEHRAYMMMENMGEWESIRWDDDTFKGTVGAIRPLIKGNIGGACIAMRYTTAKQVGAYPVQGTKYEFDEDGWRCMRVRQLGKKLGYVRCNPGAEIISYPDSSEYLEQRKQDTAKLKELWQDKTENNIPKYWG